MKTAIHTFTVAALILTSLRGRAEIELYFAQDESPWPVELTGTVPRPAFPKSQAIAAQFLSRLQGATTESFEEYPTGSFPKTLVFGASTATLTESDTNVCVVQAVSAPGTTQQGLLPITGTKLLVLDVGLVTQTDKFFRIEFSTPQAAFGFYGMDAERNHFRLTLTRPDGTTDDITPPIRIPQGSAGVFYLGVIDRSRPFTSVTFHNLESFPDAFGFDNLTIGVPGQVSAASAGLSLDRSQTLKVTGTVGATYRIESTDVLPATNWTTLTNLLLNASPADFVDSTPKTAPQRFYRAVSVD